MNPDELDEQGLPIVPEEQPQEVQPAPTVGDQIQNARDTYDQGQEHVNRFKDWRAARAEKKAAKGGLKEGVEKRGVEAAKAAKGKVAKRGAEQFAKTGARTAATTAAKTGATAATLGAEAATGPVGWVAGAITVLSIIGKPLWNGIKNNWPKIVFVLSFIFLLPAMVFGLLGLKGANITPSTNAQFGQTTLVAAIGGDFVLSGRKITQKALDAEKARYQIVLANVRRTNPDLTPRVDKDSKEILTLLETGINLSGDAKKKQTDLVIAKIQALDSTLPFGTWITDAAKGQVGKGSQNFCKVTGASSKVACASFVSTVLQSAGVPSPIRATTTAVWLNPALQTVINRLDSADAGLFNRSKDTLRPGDIIWWGDGSCSSVAYAGKEFDHIGFYIGNGMAIDNSSKAAAIKERQAASRDSNCRFFNGAKRYGKTL